MTSAVIFGVVSLAHRPSRHAVQPLMEPRTGLPLPPREALTVNNSPAMRSLAAPTFGISGQPTAKETEHAAATAALAQNIPQATETAAFKTFISSQPDPHSVIHEVMAGNTLVGIARKYHVTENLVKRINNIQGSKLNVGSKLKIPTYKFSVVVDKSQNTLILKGDEDLLKTYVVSTGKDNSTPVGDFKITNKLTNPTWYKGDGKVIPYGSPENQLGTRWMGLTKKGYGIHGTIEPEKLGQQVTAGCVRMKNEDVEELYGFLIPGTEVTIVD